MMTFIIVINLIFLLVCLGILIKVNMLLNSDVLNVDKLCIKPYTYKTHKADGNKKTYMKHKKKAFK